MIRAHLSFFVEQHARPEREPRETFFYRLDCRVAVVFDKLDKTARKGILSKSMNRQSAAPLLEGSHEIQTRRSKPDPHEGAFF